MPQGNIAIVEDEHAIARLLQINLEALDYRVTTFGNGEDFLAALNNTWPDVLIFRLDASRYRWLRDLSSYSPRETK